MCESPKKCQNCCEHKNLLYLNGDKVGCQDCKKIWQYIRPIQNVPVIYYNDYINGRWGQEWDYSLGQWVYKFY